MNDMRLKFALVPRGELGGVLRGVVEPPKLHLSTNALLPRVGGKDVVVIWAAESRRPCAILAGESSRLELYNWAVSFHPDLSPLSAWCHVLAPEEIRSLADGTMTPNLFGFEAAWTGAVIAEAMSLAERGYEELTQLACLATETYLVGRVAALHGPEAASGKRIESLARVQERLKRPGNRRRAINPTISRTLLSLLPGSFVPGGATGQLLQEASIELFRSAHEAQDEDSIPVLQSHTVSAFAALNPSLRRLADLESLPAEARVVFLRELRDQFPKGERSELLDVMSFAAGYVISTIGGGARDLRLAEAFEQHAADVLGWAATIGGLGNVPAWTDAYEGLGRLVSRELLRPFHLADPPVADASAEEVMVIVEPDRATTKNRVRTAHRNAAAISIVPGVTAFVSTADDEREKIRPTTAASAAHPPAGNDVGTNVRALAQQLWPFLRPLVEAEVLRRDRYRKKTSKSGAAPSLLRDD